METAENLDDRFDPFSSMGTQKWWDYQLAHYWEQNGGPSQTMYFMKGLIEHLPLPEKTYLSSNSLTILDCGCATGEGVALLGQAFPQCQVGGLDVARSAIETAQARYPQHEFWLTDNGEIPRQFDVVLTSNVLEHLDDPFAMARRQAASARLLYLVLVPFWEHPLMEGHLITFTDNSFPAHWSGLARLSVTPFETDPTIWAGKQVLVVYASREYLNAQPGRQLTQQWESYFNASPEVQSLLDELAIRCARAETALDGAVLTGSLTIVSMTNTNETGSSGSQRNAALLLGKLERLERLRDRLAPLGTRRREWLNGFVAWLLAKA
ncbi:MAG: class I SAM-dependent methyltransferase [Blastocatellia bacterium]